MAQRTRDDLDALLAEADSFLSAPDDDLDAALAEADALLAAPAPRPVSPQAPRRPPPAGPAAPVAPRAAGVRTPPASRAPGLLGVERGGRLTLPTMSATDLAVIESSPASRSAARPDPFARRPQAPRPDDTLGAPNVGLPARVVGGAANLGQDILEAVPAAGKGFASGTLGAAASVSGTLASGAFARDAEEARILSVPAATARKEFSPSAEYGADILDEPGVMLDPRFWGYMAGQLTGSVASLAGTGSGGRVVGQVAASKLAQRSPALAAKLAAIGGPGAATAGESLIEAVDAYQTVIADGKTPDAAAEAAARVFSANAALLGLTSHPLFDAGGRGFRQVLKRALTEGGQEAGQTMAANVATDRPTMEGVGTAALVGAVGGPVAGAILDGPADRAEAPVAPPAPSQAVPAPTPAPSVGDRIREAIAASEAARRASSFEATPAAAGAPNADLDVVLAEADAVLSSEQEAGAVSSAPPEGSRLFGTTPDVALGQPPAQTTPYSTPAPPPPTASSQADALAAEFEALRAANGSRNNRELDAALQSAVLGYDTSTAIEEIMWSLENGREDIAQAILEKIERDAARTEANAGRTGLPEGHPRRQASIDATVEAARQAKQFASSARGTFENVKKRLADAPAPPAAPPIEATTATAAGQTRPPQWKPPAVDIAPPPAQTEPDVAAGSEPGERAGEGGRVPRRRVADFRPQGRAQRAKHLDDVFADILADARELDPAVDDAAVRREFDARVELFEELNAEARQAGADPLDLLREIARLGGIDELDNGKGQHGELKRLREGQGGAVGGIKGVFRRRAYGGNGVPVAGLPLDVMLQQLQQDPRWRNLEDLNDLVEVLDDVQRGNFQRLDLLPGYDRAMRELGMRRGERWWDDPIFPPDAGAVVDETTAEDDLDAAVNEADVVLGETVDDSFDFGDVVEAPPDRQLSAQEMLDDARERIKAGAVMSPEDLQILQDLAAEEADANAGAIDLDTVIAEADTVLADTLDTGEQQTRLPGDVGAVRDEERAQPTEAVPEQSLRLTDRETATTQTGLFSGTPAADAFEEARAAAAAASRAHAEAKRRYRAKEIGDAEYLAAREAEAAALKAYDAAEAEYLKEQKRTTKKPTKAKTEAPAGGLFGEDDIAPMADGRAVTADTLAEFADSVKAEAGADLVSFDVRLDSRGVVTLEHIAVRKGAASQGVGTRAMRSLASWADRNGVRLELNVAERGFGRVTPDSTATSGTRRLEKFYQRFGFVKNTGRAKDFTTRAGMIREPRAWRDAPQAPGRSNGPSRDVLRRLRGKQTENEAADDDIAPMTAYHGSPHVFEEFSLQKIGTGEGAQAYGWGLYFADARTLAEYYRNALAGEPDILIKGRPLAHIDNRQITGRVREIVHDMGQGSPFENARAAMLSDAKQWLDRTQIGAEPDPTAPWAALRRASIAEFTAAVDFLSALKESDITLKRKGRVYTVEIPEHDEYLDWDRPIRGQGDHVRAAVRAVLPAKPVKTTDGYSVTRVRPDGTGSVLYAISQPTAAEAMAAYENYLDGATGQEVYRDLGAVLDQQGQGFQPANLLRKPKQQLASEALAAAGVPGIRYKDGATRNYRILSNTESVSGKWTVGPFNGAKSEQQYFDTREEAEAAYKKLVRFNYVVFDDRLVEVTDIAEMAKPRTASGQLEKMRAAQPPAHQKGRGGGLALSKAHQRSPGTKTIAETPKGAKPSDIVRKMSELLKTPVGTGRLITSRALGYYHRQQNAIRVKVANDLPVLMHEFGHAAERHLALNWADPRWNGELLTVGAATSLPSYTAKQRRAEGVAEFWRMWVMNPQQAQQMAPAFYRAVEGRLDQLGELGTGLRALQKQAQAFLDADPMARVHLRIDFDSAKQAPDAGTWIDKAATRWVDDLHTLRQATEAMAGGAPLPPTLNAYLMARNARGAMNRAADFLEHGVRDLNGQFMGPSLRAVLQPVYDKLPEFSVYLVALRARELHRRNIQTGLTNEEANDAVRAIEAGPDAARFAKARDGIYEFQTAMLNYAREAGVLSAAQQVAIQKANQYYVPFQRMIDAEVGQGTGRRIADRLSPVKKIKGSGRDIVNPLESIIKNAFTFVDTVEKNRAMQALTELADKADERRRPGSGGGQWLRRIKDPQTVTGVRLSEVLTEAAEKAGAMVMTQGGKSLPPELEQLLDDLNIDIEQVLPVFQTAFSGPKGEQIVTVLRDGKREFYEVENPMLYQAITMISPVARDGDLKLAELMASILRSGATLTLGFITRNPGRDTLTAFLQSRHGFIPVADTLRGAVKVLLHEFGIRSDEEVAQFWAQGITQATLVGQDRDMLRKKLRQLSEPALRHHLRTVVRNPLELLQALSAFSEVSTRMGEFSLALRQGGKHHTILERLIDRNREPIDENTLAAATLAARDVTTDFSRGGSKAKEWNQTRAFFNARVQGYARIVETVRTQPGTAALNVSALAAAAVVFRMLADDDDDYRELAEWEKLTYWHYRPQFGSYRADYFLRIPKPFEWAFAPNAVEAALDYAKDRRPEAFNLLKAQVKENARTLLLGAIPTWILPAAEATANYSFFRQGPIVSPWDTDLPLEQQASDWTSQTARGLTKLGLPLAPARIDHLLYGYTAGLGRAAVTGIIDPALRRAGLAPPAATAPAARWEDTPAIGSLVRSAAPRSDAESIREFYESYREMTGTQRGYNKAKDDPAQQARILDGVKRQRWRGRETEMKAAKKRIDDIADEIDKVYADGAMTPQQKLTSLEGMRRALVYEARVGLGYESTDHVRRRSAR